MNSVNNSQKNKKKKRFLPNFCYDFVKITGAIPTLIWFRTKVFRPFKTKTPRGGVLISANHKSLIDPIIVHTAFSSRRLHSLATKDLYNTKTKAKFFNLMNCIMVDKENFSLSSFHDVVNRLSDGKAVVIFPEGKLNREDGNALLAFKSGAVLMAHKAKAPILPVYIVKREKWYHRQHVIIGDPVDVRAIAGDMPTMEALDRASSYLRDREIELREYYEERITAKKRKKTAENKEKEVVTQ